MVITFRYGCVAELTDGEVSRTFVGEMPEVDVVSPLGWGDALVGGYAVASPGGGATGGMPALRPRLRCRQPARNTAPACSCLRMPRRFATAVELEEVPLKRGGLMASRRSWSSISVASTRNS